MCVTWDGSLMKPYRDGVPVGNGNFGNSWTGGHHGDRFGTINTLSSYNWRGSEDSRFCFDGQQANLILYKGKAATADEISEIYLKTSPE